MPNDTKLSRAALKIIRETTGLSKEKDKPTPASYLETEKYILEQVKIATHATHATEATEIRYIQYHKKTDSIDLVDSFEYEDKVYKPIIDEVIEKDSIHLPSGVKEYGNIDNLIEKIRSFYNYNFQVPTKFEPFLPYLCLFNWVYEKFPFVPYLNFVGLTTTGKTTAMEVFGSTCYKAIDVSGSITIASIFRTTTSWKGTLLLDEFENVGEESRAMISFLKSGVSNRAVLRVEGEKERAVRVYVVKCPKIFTSERPINDAGLQSRTIVIPMEKNKRPIPLYRLDKFKKEAQEIRNMLLLWRLRNLNKIDLQKLEFGFKELQIFDGRVQQVITPVYYLANEKIRKDILTFATTQEEETMRERREAVSGIIFNIIYDFIKLNKDLVLSDIADNLNSQLKLIKPYTNNKVASIIRKILGFDIQRIGHENISTVVLDKDKFEELCGYFGFVLISVASVATVASVANGESKQIKLDQLDQTDTQKLDSEISGVEEDTWTEPPIV